MAVFENQTLFHAPDAGENAGMGGQAPRNPASPTLLIGLGGTGAKCLDAIKARMKQMTDGNAPQVQFLAIDTDLSDLEDLKHLEQDERFFVMAPPLMPPVEQTQEAWNEELVRRAEHRIIAALGGCYRTPVLRDVYVIAGAGGHTGAGVFLKLPKLLSRTGQNLRLSGILFHPELFRWANYEQMHRMTSTRNNLMQAWSAGEDRTETCDGYQRCWTVGRYLRNEAPSMDTAIAEVAEILFREVTEPELRNCLEAAGLWNTDRENPDRFSLAGIVRAECDQTWIWNAYVRELLRHTGMDGTGVDELDFLQREPRHTVEGGTNLIRELVNPLYQLFRLMTELDSAYVHEFVVMTPSEFTRFLTNGGESHMMKRQDWMIQKALSDSGMRPIINRIEQTKLHFRNALQTMILQEGLGSFLNLYHGRFRGIDGSVVSGPGIRDVLYAMQEGRYPDGKEVIPLQVEMFQEHYSQQKNEFFSLQPISRIMRGQRLKDELLDVYHRLTIAKVYQARGEVILGQNGLFASIFVRGVETMIRELEQLWGLLDDIRRSCDAGLQICRSSDFVALERWNPGMENSTLQELHREACYTDPGMFRDLLLNVYLQNPDRWNADPMKAFGEMLLQYVNVPQRPLAWFFQEQIRLGHSLQITAGMVLQELEQRSSLRRIGVPGDGPETAQLLIPETLFQQEPTVCNVLVQASQNMGMHVQVIRGRVDSLCMIRTVHGLRADQV